MSTLRNGMKAFAISSLALCSTGLNADQEIIDDLVVKGSICSGLDCVNGEAFGFDTLRLKENNLRIRFVDTSSSSSFPSTDWQLSANDSANGGANRFSIEDIDSSTMPFTISGGAPSHSLYVGSSGNIGVGTSTPSMNLSVKDGNSPSLRFEQDTSSGFTAQTWDIGGNETNFFIRDITNSSKLPFKIIPGASSNSLYIASDGDVGLGTNVPGSYYGADANLDVQADASEDVLIGLNSLTSTKSSSVGFAENGTDKWLLSSRHDTDSSSTATIDRFSFQNASSQEVFTLHQSGSVYIGDSSGANNNTTHAIEVANGAHLTSGGVWTDASSRSLKNDIVDISLKAAKAALLQLNPVTYTYKSQPDEQYAGFIAEDVPDMVAMNDRKGLAPMDIVAVLTKVMQAQQKTIDQLQQRLEKLEIDNDK